MVDKTGKRLNMAKRTKGYRALKSEETEMKVAKNEGRRDLLNAAYTLNTKVEDTRESNTKEVIYG